MVPSNYRDFYAVDVTEVKTQVNIPSCKRKGPRGGVVTPFPVKLFTMLEKSCEEGLDHIVSWQVHGRCFMIHKSDHFVSKILPRFFRQTKLPSFQRQLNLWGFQKVVNGPDRGGYYHELFLRGRPDLAPIMLRIKGCSLEGIKGESSHGAVEDPDFYSYPYCKEKYMTLGPKHESMARKEPQEATLIEPLTPPISPRSQQCIGRFSPVREPLHSEANASAVTPPYESRRIDLGSKVLFRDFERRKICYQDDLQELNRTYSREWLNVVSSGWDTDEYNCDDNLFEGRTFQSIEECNAQALESILRLEEEALYAKSVLSEVKRMKERLASAGL